MIQKLKIQTHKFTKLIWSSLAVAVLALFIMGCEVGTVGESLRQADPSQRTDSELVDSELVEVDDSQLAADAVTYSCQLGQTAFEVLADNHDLQYDQTSFGKLVTSIDGLEAGDGQYWFYSIDGQPAQVGADSYHCQGEELIQWTLQ